MDHGAERPQLTRRQRTAMRRRRRQKRRVVVVGVLAVVVGVTLGLLQLQADDRAGSVASPSSATRSTTTTSAPPAAFPRLRPPYSQAVSDENVKTGTTRWRITNDGAPHDIEGYLNTTSAQRGESVDLYANTIAPSFAVEAYRMGWYQGLGARLVWTSPPITGAVQPSATLISATNTYEAHWQKSTSIAINDQWPVGSYLLKLVASTGQQRWVPLTVRDDASTAAYVIVSAVNTWQAYNRWGGCSLYDCSGGPGDRARMVSFDRPYDMSSEGSGGGASLNELPLVMRVEERGLDVTYMTSVDIHQHPQLLKQHRAVVSLGHDEYWSKTMYDAAEQARDVGVNLAFLGANAVFRQVRFEPSALGGDRHLVNYRSTTDPIRVTDPAQTTVSFRDAPVNRPEARLIGQQYQCNPVRADGVVNKASSWIWEGAGFADGQHIEILVGTEYDQYIHGQGGPDNVEIVAHSPISCRGKAGFSDVTYYTAPSGAGVFASGTNYWVSKLSPPEFPESPYNPTIVRATMNVLVAFGTGPAGTAHPSVPNWKGLPGTGK